MLVHVYRVLNTDDIPYPHCLEDATLALCTAQGMFGKQPASELRTPIGSRSRELYRVSPHVTRATFIGKASADGLAVVALWNT